MCARTHVIYLSKKKKKRYACYFTKSLIYNLALEMI